jgi:hypothetical protein
MSLSIKSIVCGLAAGQLGSPAGLALPPYGLPNLLHLLHDELYAAQFSPPQFDALSKRYAHGLGDLLWVAQVRFDRIDVSF